MAKTDPNKIIDPFDNIEFQPLPDFSQARFGEDRFRSVSEFQVGMANNESNPRVMRVNSEGMWLGQAKFRRIPNELKSFDNVKFQVDMSGNITATSFKTGSTGRRIRISKSLIEFYDQNGVSRGFITGDSTLFMSASEDMRLSADRNMLINAVNAIQFSLSSIPYAVLDSITESMVMLKTLILANLTTDPLPADSSPGMVYYNTISNTFRGYDGTAWNDL